MERSEVKGVGIPFTQLGTLEIRRKGDCRLLRRTGFFCLEGSAWSGRGKWSVRDVVDRNVGSGWFFCRWDPFHHTRSFRVSSRLVLGRLVHWTLLVKLEVYSTKEEGGRLLLYYFLWSTSLRNLYNSTRVVLPFFSSTGFIETFYYPKKRKNKVTVFEVCVTFYYTNWP